jgi:tetrahydroxynaphthalene reductase
LEEFWLMSILIVKGVPRHAVYAASKAAVQGMTKCLAVDFGSRNITVNCIAAGGVKTDMYTEMSAKYIPGGDKMSPQQIEELLSKWSPLGRVGEVEDVAGVAALIASPDSQWLTGQTWQVSGGSYMV